MGNQREYFEYGRETCVAAVQPAPPVEEETFCIECDGRNFVSAPWGDTGCPSCNPGNNLGLPYPDDETTEEQV